MKARMGYSPGFFFVLMRAACADFELDKAIDARCLASDIIDFAQKARPFRAIRVLYLAGRY